MVGVSDLPGIKAGDSGVINLAARAQCEETEFRHRQQINEALSIAAGADQELSALIVNALPPNNRGHCFCGTVTINNQEHDMCCKCGDWKAAE